MFWRLSLFFFSVFFFGHILVVCLGVFFFVFIILEVHIAFWIWGLIFFIYFKEFLAIISSDINSLSFAPVFPFGTLITHILDFDILSNILLVSFLALFSLYFNLDIFSLDRSPTIIWVWSWVTIFLYLRVKFPLGSLDISFALAPRDSGWDTGGYDMAIGRDTCYRASPLSRSPTLVDHRENPEHGSQTASWPMQTQNGLGIWRDVHSHTHTSA